MNTPSGGLPGERGLTLSIATDAELAATYLNERARPVVTRATDPLGYKLPLSCDVRVPGELDAVFERSPPNDPRSASSSTRSPSRPLTICTALSCSEDGHPS